MLRFCILALICAAPAGAEPIDLFGTGQRGSWRAITVNDFVHHGSIAFKDGVLELKAGQPGTGLRWTGKLPRSNYELSLETRRIEGFDFFCGLTFPVGKQHLTLVLGGWDGEVCGLSNIDARNASENQTRFTHRFKQDRWYRVRLRVTETRIQAWLDGKPVIDFKPGGHKLSLHPAMQPARSLGLASWYTHASFRKFKLHTLSAKKP